MKRISQLLALLGAVVVIVGCDWSSGGGANAWNTRWNPSIAGFSLMLPLNSFPESETRTWTDRKGVEVEGKLVSIDEAHVELKIDERLFRVPIADLSQTDQDYVNSHSYEMEALATAEAERDDRIRNSLLRNSDLNSKGGWRGAGLIEEIQEEDGRMVPSLNVQLHHRRLFKVEQPFRVPANVTVANLDIRYYLSEDFKSYRPTPSPITLRFVRPQHGSTYTTRALTAKPGEWGEVSWTFSQLHARNDFILVIEIHPGEGSMYFSEIVLTPVVD